MQKNSFLKTIRSILVYSGIISLLSLISQSCSYKATGIYSILEYLKYIFRKKYICKAPYNSIYISGNGSVTTCCFNRTDVLGNIYETPLKDILNNSKTKELKDTIKQGIYPKGCEICKKHVENKNKANSGIITYEKFPVQKGFLSIIELELSYKCNLRCLMCRLNEDNLFVNPAKTVNKKFNILKQITPYLEKVKLMRFYGGEPFFIDEYYSIWDTVINNNPDCRFIVQTNSTIFNNRIKDLILKGRFNFSISIDSLNKYTYESIRKGADFDKTMINLHKFHSISKKNKETITISVCPMRINWKEMPQLVEFCNKNKIFIFFNSVFSPWKMALWNLSKTELAEIYNILSVYKFHSFSSVSFINKVRWESFLNQLYQWNLEAQKRPSLTNQEKENWKTQIFNALTNKFSKYKPEKYTFLLETEFKQKVFDLLNELLNYIHPSKILKKIEDSDAIEIYNTIRLKLNDTILEKLLADTLFN